MYRQRCFVANEKPVESKVKRRNNTDAELDFVFCFFHSGSPPEVTGGKNMFGQSSFSLEAQWQSFRLCR